MQTAKRFVLFLVAVLSGCAHLEKDAGFQLETKSSIGRQEPWHNLTLVGDIRKTMAISIAYVGLPTPPHKEWKEEFMDVSRVYVVDQPDGKKARKPLERVVFRALVYRGERFSEMFDAVLNPSATGFFVLLPASAEEYKGTNLVIVPSDARWLMTAQGERVELEEGETLERLPQGFFEQHPAKMTQVIPLGRMDPGGRQLLAELETLFPLHFTVQGIPYSGRPDTWVVGAKFTKVEAALDKLVSCGSAAMAPGLVTVGLAVAVVRNGYVITKPDCFK